MKNKKLTYGLLVLVAGIWGSIIYRFVDWEDEDTHIVQEPLVLPEQETAEIKDTAELWLNYRDPFLDKPYRPLKTKIARKTPPVKSKQQKDTAPAQWPAVEYGGVISNKATSNKMALIKINGREHLLKEGQSSDGIEVSRIYGDSIALAYLNDIKTFWK